MAFNEPTFFETFEKREQYGCYWRGSEWSLAVVRSGRSGPVTVLVRLPATRDDWIGFAGLCEAREVLEAFRKWWEAGHIGAGADESYVLPKEEA